MKPWRLRRRCRAASTENTNFPGPTPSLVMTVTNAQGTENHKAGSPVGHIDSVKIIYVDDHKLIYETGGHTNTLAR